MKFFNFLKTKFHWNLLVHNYTALFRELTHDNGTVCRISVPRASGETFGKMFCRREFSDGRKCWIFALQTPPTFSFRAVCRAQYDDSRKIGATPCRAHMQPFQEYPAGLGRKCMHSKFTGESENSDTPRHPSKSTGLSAEVEKVEVSGKSRQELGGG